MRNSITLARFEYLAKELKERREALQEKAKKKDKSKYSQEGVAAAVGIKQPYFNKIEKGSANPKYKLVCKMIEYYDKEEGASDKIASSYHQGIEAVEPEDTVWEARKLMKKKGYSQLPVFKGNENVGSVTDKMISRAIAQFGKKKAYRMEVSKLGGTPFPTIDCENPIESIRDALDYIPLFIVTKNGKISGTLTMEDII